MLSIFKPAAHTARVPSDKVDPLYRKLRWQIFLGIFFGYAAYYLVRKNFTLAMPYLIEQGFSRGDLGFALSGISIAYGFSKFIMGSVSDRSNPRVFLPAGLIPAAAVMLFMGFVPWATSSIAIMFVLLFLCGWFQGMGWPPCGHHGALVVAERTRRHRFHLELRPQRGWRPAAAAVPAGYGLVQRLARGAVHAGLRRHPGGPDRLRPDARHPAILRPAAD